MGSCHDDTVTPASQKGAMQDISAALDECTEALRHLYGDRLHKVILFGSRARGDGTDDSDVDLAVVLDGPVAPFEGLKRIVTAFVDIGLEHYLDLSPVPLSTSEWDEPDTYTNPDLIDAIRKDGIVLWQKAEAVPLP
jgi:predicted nucleotidyltransferase